MIVVSTTCHIVSTSCQFFSGGSCGRDRMVVGFITTHGISAYHHYVGIYDSQNKVEYGLELVHH
jgi:hypothetical protein